MEIKIDTKQLLKILYVVTWIIFIGICIEAGGFIFNAFYTMVLNPVGAQYFWKEIDLSTLYKFDPGLFLVETTLMSIVAIMKATLFYLILKILHDKKINITTPFNRELGRFVFNLSYLTFGLGFFSHWGTKYTGWLVNQGVKMPEIQHLNFGGADVWLFMGVTIYVIALIFRRGIEIQEENELTV
jgi:hypothetical protein